MNNQITYLNVKKIFPHENNPRKNLGDLTELADSIKANGIMQNLTVVARGGDTYTAIIGHRRLAAAKKAGLKEVPCIIAEMDEKTQIATMLLENIQRNDLTVLEQAAGFQMMLDLGDTEQEIADKTGFSASTIRRRTKLLALDQDGLKKAVARGATLMDFAELDKITDPDRRNKCLNAIGTTNFKWELQSALTAEKREKNRKRYIEILKGFATEIEDATGYAYISYVNTEADPENYEAPQDAQERNYYYRVTNYSLDLYVKKSADETAADDADRQRNEVLRGIGRDLDEVARKAFNLRFEFMRDLTGLKQKMNIIYEMIVRGMLIGDWNHKFNFDNFIDLLALDPAEDEDFTYQSVEELFKQNPEKVLLAAAYANCGDGERANYHRSWNAAYEENETLDAVYDMLTRLGYTISDEELAYKNGTHELFQEVIHAE